MSLVIEHRRTDELILAAADRLLARHGLRKMTMEHVAAEAGVSRRTVYGYFASKQELALGTIDRVVKLAMQKMGEEAAKDIPIAQRLARMLIARIEVRHQEIQDRSRVLDQIYEAIRPAYMKRRREWFEQEARQVAEVIRTGQRMGEFGPEDSLESAAILIRATNAFLPFSLSLDELGEASEISRRLRRMAEVLVNGLRLAPASRRDA